MDLGMARERLADDPTRQELVAGAHEQAKQAITELRDLARGIHPVVLTDRGLPAALATLAGHSHIPVELDVQTGERPAAARGGRRLLRGRRGAHQRQQAQRRHQGHGAGAAQRPGAAR